VTRMSHCLHCYNQSMKATLYAALKPGLETVPLTVDLSEPGEDEVLIRITHCSVARGDVGFLENSFNIPQVKYPVVAGHELVGEVVACGKTVTGFAQCERVGVGYQVWSCARCEYCLNGRENLCAKQRCLVLDEQGGFASHILVDQRFVFKIPQSLKSSEAAPLLCAGVTTYSAIKHALIIEGMKVGVVGVGGLGHIGIQLLHHFGAQVSAFSSKLEDSRSIQLLGASEVLPYEWDALDAKIFDRLFVTTHAQINYDYYLNLLKPDGELWMLGSPAHKTVFSSNLLNDFAHRTIRGNYIGSPKEMRELLALAGSHKIKGVVEVMAISRLDEALRRVSIGNDHFRIVIANN